MDDSLRLYIKNVQVNKAAIDSRLTHPFSAMRYPARLVFVQLKRYAGTFLESGSTLRCVGITGFRGLGKTTLLWQTANYVWQHFRQPIYFFNVTALRSMNVSLHEALDALQEWVLERRFNQIDTPFTILLDEVQEDPDWCKTLKNLFDEARTALIICTGSQELEAGRSADLANRMRIEKIYPFRFSEFVAAKTYIDDRANMLYPAAGLSTQLKECLFFSDTADTAFASLAALTPRIQAYYAEIETGRKLNINDLVQRYVSYQNIPNFLFYKEKYTITDSLLGLFTRMLREDIERWSVGPETLQQIERLILHLATTDEVNISKLADIVGIAPERTEDIIDRLASSELLYVLPPHSKGSGLPKAFFTSPSIRRALLAPLYGHKIPDNFRFMMMEDVIVMYLQRLLMGSILSAASENTSAFVVETRDVPLLLEVGLASVKAVQKFRYHIQVSNQITEPSFENGCIRLPLRWFLLL
ncbi:MAG: AAA family ATPase [Bacteroidales bacterium]|jgi:predicted AAA+ superfamily ATPase|nr:AAA family ATPase [Bacteroidales bacterium]